MPSKRINSPTGLQCLSFSRSRLSCEQSRPGQGGKNSMAEAANTLVEAAALTRYYADRRAVDNLSFSLARGEVLGFLGPNGAGKTTTMQMLCGVLAPGQGSIRIGGID